MLTKLPLRRTHNALLLLWFCSVGCLATVGAAVPGGIYTLTLPADTTSATYQRRPVFVIDGTAVVGIPLSASPGEHTLQIVDKHGNAASHRFLVNAKQYPEQRITIDNPRMVNPIQSDLERIRGESARMRSGYLSFLEADTEQVRPFVKPVAGVTSSPFGRRRILNDQPRNPHSGLDIAATTGTPVVAPAPATVTLTGEFYFNGNTVFLDHGQGLVTMYCHLSKINVTEGAVIGRGDTLGLVGATGRATGPHLHWSVSLNGNRVDPELVMALLANPQTDRPPEQPAD